MISYSLSMLSEVPAGVLFAKAPTSAEGQRTLAARVEQTLFLTTAAVQMGEEVKEGEYLMRGKRYIVPESARACSDYSSKLEF